MSEEKTIIKTDKETLTEYHNQFQGNLIAITLDLKRYRIVKTVDPDFQKQDKQGRYHTVDDLIEECEKKAANAKSYVGIVDELLAMDEAGNLPEAWADISEVSKEEESKDDAPKEIEEPKEEATN